MSIVAGVDVGSLHTKVLILRKETVLSHAVVRSSSQYQEAAEACMTEALRLAGLTMSDMCYVVSSGYGRAVVPFSNKQVTEISCHARGAKWLFPEAHTVIDIGGQDSKAIILGDGGTISNFVMNDKCAAGTGRFLEVMAQSLEVSLDELGKLSLRSGKELTISSTCTVFAESEIISLYAARESKADIAGAIFRAIARRVGAMVTQMGVREPVVMSGGVAKNVGVVIALEKQLGVSILVPDEPQIVGALGAALIADEQCELKSA